MKKMEPRHIRGVKAKEDSRSGPTSVSQIVRTAERYVAEGRFGLALDQLTIAKSLDPQNQYIGAIIERVQALERAVPSRQSDRYLSVTVGHQYEAGVRGRDEENMSADELRTRVRELTEAAGILLNRGLSESAFETLMRAYLLDPVSPDVLACEKSVLPAWELVRKQRADISVQASRMRELNASVAPPSVRANVLRKAQEVGQNSRPLRNAPPSRGVGRKPR
jgi:hypothetical protein